MTWFDIYNEFIKNFEKVNQLQKDYIINLERINYLYNESIKSIEKVNHLYNEYNRNYEKMSRSYEQQFDNMQRMNQRWLDLFSKSWNLRNELQHEDRAIKYSSNQAEEAENVIDQAIECLKLLKSKYGNR
jgi:LPS O-antigen subunit length determinant protein (WzzB/FepE family)